MKPFEWFARTPGRLLLALSLLLLLSCILFLTLNAHGAWDFVLPLRGKKLLLLLTVAYALGVSTLLFQTLTHNPILTPSILGFDALYLLLQTGLIFSLGGMGFTQLPQGGKFVLETLLMIGASLLLFRTLTRQSHGDLARMVLVGVIFGVLFRSINTLLQRMIDPNVFAVAQTASFAQFNTVDPTLLIIGMAIAAASIIWIWRMRHVLDVLLLGQNHAVSLGVNYRRTSRIVLIWVAVLVASATALVGSMSPSGSAVSFFGLLVCALVNLMAPKMHHALRIPLAFLVAAITLVLGQTVFEQLLGLKAVLNVVIEFLGGCVFILLILKYKKQQP